MTVSDDPWQTFLASLPPELRALHQDAAADRAEDVAMVGDRRVGLADLLDVLAEQVATPPNVGERTLRQDRRGAGLLAGAWRHIAFGQARAVLVLLDAGRCLEAQANARACLEHAVAARRLALAADVGDLASLMSALATEGQRRDAAELDYLDGLDEAAGGSHRALLDAARSEHEARRLLREKSWPEVRTAKAMFEAAAPGGHLYSVYRRLSESTHAGLGSAAPYLAPALRTPSRARLPATPEPVSWAETATLLCWSCWAADDAMLRFLDDGADLADRQVQLLARVGLAPG